jgi:hypothetical protein
MGQTARMTVGDDPEAWASRIVMDMIDHTVHEEPFDNTTEEGRTKRFCTARGVGHNGCMRCRMNALEDALAEDSFDGLDTEIMNELDRLRSILFNVLIEFRTTDRTGPAFKRAQAFCRSRGYQI